MRLQLALNVDDLERAVDFYSKLFDAQPAKRKPGYANFAIADPPLKLVLFEAPGAPERLNHLGVEVFEAEGVTAATERLMYGSDWPMILREPDGHACLSHFLAFFEENFPDLREDVFGRNALRFLGLLEPTRNRGRLLVFYERVEHGFRPQWWRFIRPSAE